MRNAGRVNLKLRSSVQMCSIFLLQPRHTLENRKATAFQECEDWSSEIPLKKTENPTCPVIEPATTIKLNCVCWSFCPA
jgi:hypothetical protein